MPWAGIEPATRRFSKAVMVKPKTAAGVRDVPIVGELAQAARYMNEKGGAPLERLDGGQATISVLRKAWASYNEYLADHGCTRPIRCHDLRHTYCTRLLESGVAIKMVQYWMGHADVRMTLSVYAHVTRAQEMADVSKIGELFCVRD